MKKRYRRYIAALTISCAALLLTPIIIAEYLAPGYYVQTENVESADAIVVISGGGRERLEHGAELFLREKAPLLILSGAAREGNDSNAEAMKRMATNTQTYDIPASQIITDDFSQNTYENAVNVKAIVEEHNLESFILVTTAYHQRRAYRTFRAVFGRETDIINHPAKVTFWTPYSWWRTEAGRTITLSECGKILWTMLTGAYA